VEVLGDVEDQVLGRMKDANDAFKADRRDINMTVQRIWSVDCIACRASCASYLTECFVEPPCTNATIQEVVCTMQTIRRILSESFSSARWQDMVVAIGQFDRLPAVHLACRLGTVEPNLAVDFVQTSDHSVQR
jgi:hypothetical protein